MGRIRNSVPLSVSSHLSTGSAVEKRRARIRTGRTGQTCSNVVALIPQYAAASARLNKRGSSGRWTRDAMSCPRCLSVVETCKLTLRNNENPYLIPYGQYWRPTVSEICRHLRRNVEFCSVSRPSSVNPHIAVRKAEMKAHIRRSKLRAKSSLSCRWCKNERDARTIS